MADLKRINDENQAQRERLRILVLSLSDKQLTRKLPNGWTVAVTLAHLAFWDERISVLLRRLLKDGVPPTSIDADAVNGPLAILSETIPPRETVRLVLEAAERVDRDVAELPEAVVEQFLKEGKDRFIRRSLHRMGHLDKIEKTLEANG
jgi:hypothetical protein